MIRHINDYGSIILLDERFKNGQIKISNWLESCKRTYGKVEDLARDLQQFFSQHITLQMGVFQSDNTSGRKGSHADGFGGGGGKDGGYKQAKLGGYQSRR